MKYYEIVYYVLRSEKQLAQCRVDMVSDEATQDPSP